MSVQEKISIQDSILAAVDTLISQRNSELKLDKTVVATIESSVGVRDGRSVYRVKYDGGYFNAVVQNSSDSYLHNMAVYVMIPESDFSKEKIIIGRASSIGSEKKLNVVAAAVNNFSIVGKNVLAPAGEQKSYGVHSYHSIQEEQSQRDSVTHRYLPLYQNGSENNLLKISEDSLNTYIQESSALMIKGQFRTALSEVQKKLGTGRYGIVFTFVFDNMSAGLGETQGEVFDALAPIITDGEKSLKDYDNDFNALLNTQITDVNALIAPETGYIDQLINHLQELYRVFNINHPEQNTDIISNLMQAYLLLLDELMLYGSVDEIKENYLFWKETPIGDRGEKYVSYFLDSDSMIGVPYEFNNWSTQYTVFELDLSTFKRIDSIILYKDGFNESATYEQQWPLSNPGGPDIFCRNIELYAMKPLDSQSGDYQLKVEAPNTGTILSSQVEKVTFNATVTRQIYEDLTTNNSVTYYWFRESKEVTGAGSAGYHAYGGVGWEHLNSTSTYVFSTTLAENRGYKTNYKCTAIYDGGDEQVLLTTTFVVYNANAETDIFLESDLGTNFKFDSGSPTITCLIEKDGEKKEQSGSLEYRYCWAIVDENGQRTFLNAEQTIDYSTLSIDNINSYISQKALLNGIKLYNGEEETTSLTDATRIKYPVMNVVLDAQITFECYVERFFDDGFFPIGSATLTIYNEGSASPNDYRIIIENDSQIFQYDEYGDAPNANKKKDPLTVLPIRAKLMAPNGLEVTDTNYQVQWIIPIERTMINVLETIERNPATDRQELVRGQNVSFSIAEHFDPDAENNQLMAHVIFDGRDFYKDTNFLFTKVGNNGTNGTDVVAKIEPGIWSDVLVDQPLTLYQDSTKVFLNNYPRPNTGIDKLIIANGTEGPLVGKLFQKNQEITFSRIRWNLAGNALTGSINKGKHFELSNNVLTWDKTIESGSGSSSMRYTLQNIKAEFATSDNRVYYAYMSLPVVWYEGSVPILEKNRIGIDKKTYLQEIVYNADGRNPVYNHNQGVKLINLPPDCTIYWYARGGLNAYENKPCIHLLVEKEDNTTEQVDTLTTYNYEDSTSMVYIIPDDSFTGSATNNHVRADVMKNGVTLARVYVPINMTLNTFGLASLNAWDGNSVTIDNDGGYVMAPQVGAGEKDSNNRFTGILMGKTETYTGASTKEKQTGLFGYHDGLQSIFLDANTGEATFGLPDVDSNGYYTNSSRRNTDNYNEGRVELRPGGVSKIGGWRLGHRSLYYTATGEIGSKYSDDWVPNKAGIITNSNIYNKHHEKDVAHNTSGILLHSGDSPYISVKGAPLKESDISTSAISNLRAGDSLEIQLDPNTPTLFTIFRHNGTTRGKYEKDSRTYLAGISPAGELVANSIASTTQGDSGSSSDVVTGLKMTAINAFSDLASDGVYSYVGLRLTAGNYSVGDFFVDQDDIVDGTLHITGGGYNNSNGEYGRPIALHGKTISLYAQQSGASASQNRAETTNTHIILSKDGIEEKVNDYNYIKLGNSATVISEYKAQGPQSVSIGKQITLEQTGADSGSINTINLKTGLNTTLSSGDINTTLNNGSYNLTATGSDKNITLSNVVGSTKKSALKLASDRSQFGFLRSDGYSTGSSGTGTSEIVLYPGNEGVSWWQSCNQVWIGSLANQVYIESNLDKRGAGQGQSEGASGIVLKAKGAKTSTLYIAGTNDDFGGGGTSIQGDSFNFTSGYEGGFRLHHYYNTGKAVSVFEITGNAEVTRGQWIGGNYYGLPYGLLVRQGIGIYTSEASDGGGLASWKFLSDWNATSNVQIYSPGGEGTFKYYNGSYYIDAADMRELIVQLLGAVNNLWHYADGTYAKAASLGSAAYANTTDFRSSTWTPSASDVGAAPASHSHSEYKINNFAVASGGPYNVSIGFYQGSDYIGSQTTVLH